MLDGQVVVQGQTPSRGRRFLWKAGCARCRPHRAGRRFLSARSSEAFAGQLSVDGVDGVDHGGGGDGRNRWRRCQKDSGGFIPMNLETRSCPQGLLLAVAFRFRWKSILSPMVMEEMARFGARWVTATGPPKPCALAAGDPPPLRSEIWLCPPGLIPPLTAEEVRSRRKWRRWCFSPLARSP